MKLKQLTPEEEHVILYEGTESPFSGKYVNFSELGIYSCKRCGAYLYQSVHKFDAHCGWPSFDKAILGAIKSSTDPDGIRTEISCRRCGGHIGHIFFGEGLTNENTRHCANSISLQFLPKKEAITKAKAYLGGGCFWCTEAVFAAVQGVKEINPGYAGGIVENPTYQQVCSGKTGHAEVAEIIYNPCIISYEGLLEIFFTSHDPTTLNRQGYDVGPQYRSIILYTSKLEQEIAQKTIHQHEKNAVFNNLIVTEVVPLKAFYPAEDYHKDYYANNINEPYCRAVITPKLSKMRIELQAYLAHK